MYCIIKSILLVLFCQLQDLYYLGDGMEGRSNNPVALLFDTLNHPGVDVGDELPSSLEWRYDPSKAIPHLVLGKQCPGGCWSNMEDSLLTLSHSDWLELPILSYQHWRKKVNLVNSVTNHCDIRTTAGNVGQYYSSYIQEMGLGSNFISNVTVTSLEHFNHSLANGREVDLKRKLEIKLPQAKRLPEQPESDEEVGSCPGSPNSVSSNVSDVSENSEDSGCCGCPCMQYSALSISDSPSHPWLLRGWCGRKSRYFSILAKTVVLACGTNDKRNVLGVPGEHLLFVKNEFCTKDIVQLSSHSKPVVVVGAGLSAADAILALLEKKISVVHVFRKRPTEVANVYARLSPTVYPEYTHVFALMTGRTVDSCYHSYPEHVVKRFDKNKKCQLEKLDDGSMTMLECSMVFLLIGGLADLNFISPRIPVRGVDPQNPLIHPGHNPLSVDPYSFAIDGVDNMYAIGSLVGDNFVRFVLGSALGVVNHLHKTC